jgi:hypothetical protein
MRREVMLQLLHRGLNMQSQRSRFVKHGNTTKLSTYQDRSRAKEESWLETCFYRGDKQDGEEG